MNTAAIGARARQAKFSVVLVAVLTGVFYGPGWVLGRVWFCIAWAGCAIAEGFSSGARRLDGPDTSGE